MRTFKVKIIANGDCAEWASWPEKIARVKQFYSSVCDLEIDFATADFTNIPVMLLPCLVTSFGPSGVIDTPGTQLYIAPDWRAKNVGPLVQGYDIGIFQASELWKLGMPLGIFTGNGTIDTYLNGENDHVYLDTPATGNLDLGEEVPLIIAHEISHAFYALLGKPDMTHAHYYAGHLEQVLLDFNFPQTVEDGLQQLIAVLQEELAELKKKQ